MTEQTIKPGWYVINSSLGMTVLWRGEEFWSGRNPEWPDIARLDLPIAWTLGPRVEDLLREAKRYRWLRYNSEYIKCRQFHWVGQGDVEAFAEDLDTAIDAEITREKENDHD